MRLSEIAEFVVKNYPDCCMAENHEYKLGCRDDWYEEYLIDPLMNFFSYEIMGLCGCGCPEDTHRVIRYVLNIRNDWMNKNIKYDEVKNRYCSDLHIDLSYDVHHGMLQYILYDLNDHGILEHGSSVGGSWLTNLGKMYLDVLNAWYAREYSEKGRE